MKTNVLLIAVVLTAVSCTTTDPTEKQVPEITALNPDDRGTAVPKTKTEEDATDEEPEVYTDFGEFWSEFREAVEENDVEDLLELTNFPFETRGELDSDPVIKYNEKQMKKVLPLLLKQEVINMGPGNSNALVMTTEAAEIIKTKKVNQEDISEATVRVSNFVFRKGKEGWKFAFAYVNEDTYERIGK